ncbi:hypothetical protein AKJ38_02560, partial [candidate division MSBL1 archaeon SCGC-AAA259I14]
DPAPHEKKKDSHILDKLTDKDELSGLLNWALDGLDRLREQNHFSNAEERKDVEAVWISKTDSLKAFVNREVEVAPGYFITKDDFHRVYTAWCEETNVEAEILSKQKVGSRLPKKIGQASPGKGKVNEKRKTVWRGIRFKRDSFKKYNHRFKEERKRGSDVRDVRDIYSFSLSEGINQNQSIEEEKEGRGEIPDISDTSNESKRIRVEVVESFVHSSEKYEPGQTVNFPEDAARKAIEKGYVEEAGKGKNSSFSNSPTQEDKVRKLWEIIEEVSEDYGGDVPVDILIDEAKGEGIDQDFVEEFKRQALRTGELISSEKDGEKAVRRNA